MIFERSLNGAIAGGLAAAASAAQQPLDKQLFRSGFDELELLGKLVTRDRWWPAAGLALHVGNGALFGAIYAQSRPFIPGPALARGPLAALAENFVSWPPVAQLSDRYHPARDDLPKLTGNPHALAQATWRHAVFGIVLGELERRLNPEHDEPPPIPVASNGHGDLEAAVGAAETPSSRPSA